MSDSGFTGVPARPPATGQNANTPSSEPTVRLIGVPNEIRAELQTRRASIRVQGEVVRHNDDGSIRVRTPRGDVDVRVREGQTPPERGTRVELEIQPNRNSERPPETANLREIPRSDAPAQRPSATPVDVEVRPQSEAPQPRQPLPADIRHAQNTSERTPQPLPAEGSVVRLQPLPTRVAQALPTPDITQQIVATITEPAAFQAQIISQQATSDLQQAVLNIQTPVQPSVSAETIPLTSQNAPPPILNHQTAQPPILQTAAPSIEILQTPLSQTSQTPVTLNTQNFIPTVNVALPTPPSTPNEPAAITTTPALAPLQILAQPLAPQTPSTFFTPQTQPTNTLQTATPLVLKPDALDVRIERITPPDARIIPATPEQNGKTPPPKSENMILQNQNAGSLNGVVTNITNDALPVLTVFFPQIGTEQIFTLQFPSEHITIGTQIQVTPQTTTQNVNTALPQNVPLPITLAPGPWPALDDALQILARTAPQIAQATVNVTPSPSAPAQLGPAVMFFVAAIRGGDLSQWLGDKASEILKIQKGGKALTRLMGDGASLSRAAAEPTPQDWRALNIPLYWEGDMHKIGLYYKHEHEDGSDEQSELKSTRFVFDLSLDRMGKVQIDGLFRPGRLDVALRTEEHFSQATKSEMRRIYAKALHDTQITGELSFQNQPESWVTIQADNKNALGVNA